MALSDSDPECSEDYNEEFEEEDYGSDPVYHSGTDPSYSIEDYTSTKFQKLSIKKKSISDEKDPDFEVDFSHVGNIIKDGRLEKLKIDECKVYLRKNGLRLSGNKDVLIQRIKEHFEVSNGGGEKKYPLSSFILNCKGDACTGDVVMFEQNVYEMFSIASRSASGPPCGTRIVAGRIVKESYGAAKQQHTFTIEVLWSKGEKPLPPLHPLLIKGRNLYRLKTLRQKWEDEGERQRVLMEKHSRGSLARSDRGVRIEEKERRKMLRSNRILKREQNNKNKCQSKLSSTPIEIGSQQTVSSTNFGRIVPRQQQSSSITTPQSGFSVETQRLPVQPQSGYPNVRVCNSSQNQIPRNSLKSNDIREVQLQNGAKLYVNNNQPNSDMNRNSNWNLGYEKTMLSMNHCRKEIPQLRSMNHCHPVTMPQRQGFLSQQLCRYHSQGRCYHGENCKFVHEPREFHAFRVAEERRYPRHFK